MDVIDHSKKYAAAAGERRTVRVSPGEGRRAADGEAAGLVRIAMESQEEETVRAVARDGVLEGEFLFSGEQEHRILLDGRIVAGVYSLEADLFERTPYKGDFHIHSNSSDGEQAPERVVVSARAIGMDFLAITDHRRYQPSLDAVAKFSGYDGEMLLLPGEEIHPPENPVHMINFGGSFSINALFDETYEREVAAMAAASGLAGAHAMHHASCTWCFDKVAEAGGISLLCHPHWVTKNRYNVHPDLLDQLFADGRFTAFELLGGHECESNVLQTAYWNRKRAEGIRRPVVGVSDAHETYPGGEFFDWTYTVLFARSLTLEGIRESVVNGYAAAVETLPGEQPRVHGDYRMVKYALFLLREYFPGHDKLCATDALNMEKHLLTTP